MACALEMQPQKDSTRETRIFIRHIDRFFDHLNVKGPKIGEMKRKDSLLPYASPKDERFKVNYLIYTCKYSVVIMTDELQWLSENLLTYLKEWEDECKALPCQ